MTIVGAILLVAAVVVHQALSTNKSKPVATKQNATGEASTAPKSSAQAPAAANNGSVTVNDRSSSSTTVNGKTTTTIAPVNVTITSNDSSASQTSIGVSKGAVVTITFKVSADGTYHGGLQFKSSSPNLSTGVIAPGGSATLKFTADHSFSFQPYWADGTPKNYNIAINAS